MNRIATCLILCITLAVTSACKRPTQDPTSTTNVAIASVVQLATTESVAIGLREWAAKKNNTAEAVATAQLIRDQAQNVILPYLAGQPNIETTAVTAILQSDKFKALDPQIAGIINGAVSLLQAYLPPPQAGTYLSPTQITYVRAFLTGIAAGANQFLAAQPAAPPVFTAAPPK